MKVLSNLEHFYTPGGSVLMGGEGTVFTATLKPEQLITTMLEFGKVQDAQQQDFQPTGTDPLAHCLVCALPTRETLDDGELLRHAAPFICCPGPATCESFIDVAGSLSQEPPCPRTSLPSWLPTP